MKNLLSLIALLICISVSCQTVTVPVSPGDSLVKFTVTIGQASINYSVIKKTTPPVVTPPPVDPGNGNNGTLIFQSGYDKIEDITTNNGQYGKGVISTDKFVTGPGSFLSIPENVSSGIRSEVQYTDNNQNPNEGVTEWDVMYSVIVPDNGHSFQFHPNTTGGSASPGLWHINGKFVWVNWKSGGNTQHPTGMTIPQNQWLHCRIEYKFGSNGYFRWYVDGVLKCSWSGQVGDNSGHYLKVGYNGWDGNSMNSRIYYDNLKVWQK